MKTKYLFIPLLVIFQFLASPSQAQNVKQSISVLNLDCKGLNSTLDAVQLGNLARFELEKLDTFEVTDRYDAAYLLEKNQISANNCYGKICLLEIGKVIKTDYILTGSVEMFGDWIVLTLKLIDVKQAAIIKTQISEYNNIQNEMQSMMRLSIAKLLSRPYDEDLNQILTKKYDYDNAVNNPNKTKVNLSGPRFGYSFVFGESAAAMKRSDVDGGFNAFPGAFQFGYQFEKQYLNEGNCQALLEFIPMISGVDQQMAVPSFTVLNGFRHTKNGLEIAIGPTFSLTPKLSGGLVDGKFYTHDELTKNKITDYQSVERIDSRGKEKLTTALVLAFGKTFKSGKMNIPVNLYFTVPTKEGFRVGFSVGYNAKRSK